tara:strand:- start:1716 stop:2315 length:600 start_codon:yes stop_codon:yes gene_type:complete
MEITSTNLLSYIKIYDQIIDDHTLDVFLKICKEESNFNEAGLAYSKKENNIVNKNIRDVKSWNLVNIGEESRTKVFWANYFSFKFNEHIRKYFNDNNLWSLNTDWSITDIQVLKYGKNGKYSFHVDHGPFTSRTISCIYFVNDDYQGGELCFKFPGQEEELIIEKKKNRMIVWPSNFLYPHAVKPVTEGIRYSVVSWAL